MKLSLMQNYFDANKALRQMTQKLWNLIIINKTAIKLF